MTGRHTFWTAAKYIDGESAKFVMGHADESMGAWYTHLDDGKLQRLSDLADALYQKFMVQTATDIKRFRFRPLRLAGAATGAAAASA